MDAQPSPWRGRRVLVTGCTGFLGSAVTRELLTRGAVVVGLVRSAAAGFARERDSGQFRPVHGRVEDIFRLHSALAVHEVSAVFHLASSTPFGNDRGTAAVLRAASLYHPRLVVVAPRPSGELRLATGEEEPPAVPFGVARFGELFGGGDRKAFRVVPRTVRGLLAETPEPTATDGPTRDFVFVRDAARACLLLAESVATECRPLDFTFRSGWELDEGTMARLVAEVLAGRTPAPSVAEPPANPLGWQPETPLGAALAETLAWYWEHGRPRAGDSQKSGRKAA